MYGQLLQQQYDINKSLLLHIKGAERELFSSSIMGDWEMESE